MPEIAAPLPLVRKLDEMEARYAQLQESLNDPAVTSSGPRMVAISKESGQLEPVVSKYRDYKNAARQGEDLKGMLSDAEMGELATAELPEAHAKANELLESLKDEFVAAE